MENESIFTLKLLTLSTQLCFMNLPFLIIASKCTLGTVSPEGKEDCCFNKMDVYLLC